MARSVRRRRRRPHRLLKLLVLLALCAVFFWWSNHSLQTDRFTYRSPQIGRASGRERV